VPRPRPAIAVPERASRLPPRCANFSVQRRLGSLHSCTCSKSATGRYRFGTNSSADRASPTVGTRHCNGADRSRKLDPAASHQGTTHRKGTADRRRKLDPAARTGTTRRKGAAAEGAAGSTRTSSNLAASRPGTRRHKGAEAVAGTCTKSDPAACRPGTTGRKRARAVRRCSLWAPRWCPSRTRPRRMTRALRRRYRQ
jgi:hypothetical protein